MAERLTHALLSIPELLPLTHGSGSGGNLSISGMESLASHAAVMALTSAGQGGQLPAAGSAPLLSGASTSSMGVAGSALSAAAAAASSGVHHSRALSVNVPCTNAATGLTWSGAGMSPTPGVPLSPATRPEFMPLLTFLQQLEQLCAGSLLSPDASAIDTYVAATVTHISGSDEGALKPEVMGGEGAAAAAWQRFRDLAVEEDVTARQLAIHWLHQVR